MTMHQKIVKPKMGLLELGKQLGNVAEACRIMGYSRDSYYRFKRQYEMNGEEGLKEISRKQPNVKNRVDPGIEAAVLRMTYEYPAYGQVRISNELRRQGVFISPGGVRCVWLRHDLEVFQKRLKALEVKAAQEGLVFTEAQLMALERKKEEERDHGEIESEHPGYLGAQDTFYVGTIKGVGRVYQQTFIDTYCKYADAKVYTSKTPLTAADLLNDRILPFFNQYEIPLVRILTDRGTEFCGVLEHHPYELLLDLEEIEHTRTKARHPQTNGICERFHKTILNEFYRIAFRKRIYTTLEELQADLDVWLKEYNENRPHSGKWCYGKTPLETFHESLHIAKEKMIGYQESVSEMTGEVVAVR